MNEYKPFWTKELLDLQLAKWIEWYILCDQECRTSFSQHAAEAKLVHAKWAQIDKHGDAHGLPCLSRACVD